MTMPGKTMGAPCLHSPSDAAQDALDRLFSLRYHDLFQAARYYLGHETTQQELQPSDLIHEVYLQIARCQRIAFEDETHFMGYACTCMRHHLAGLARTRMTWKRGGGHTHCSVEDMADALPMQCNPERTMAIVGAMRGLKRHDRRKNLIVRLYLQEGWTMSDIAIGLELSERTVKREWKAARQWLCNALPTRFAEAI